MVLAVLHVERFVDLAPREVFATLLDEGRYLCSEGTMYRTLEGERRGARVRDQLRQPVFGGESPLDGQRECEPRADDMVRRIR